MSNKSAPADVSKARLAALKKLGLLRDIDARKKLTDAQKKRIREATRKNHALLTAEKGDYFKQDLLDHYNATQKRELQAAGVKIVGNTAYIPRQEYKDAKLVRELTYIDGKPHMLTMIRRTYGDRKISDEFVLSPVKKAEWAERLMGEYNAMDLKEGQFFAVKAYDNRPIARSFENISDFFTYESHMQLSDDTDRDKLRRNLHLVRITVKELRYLDIGSYDRTTRKKQSAARRKKAKPLHSGRLKKPNRH